MSAPAAATVAAEALAPVPPLAAVELVCRHACDELTGVRDAVQLISDFIDRSQMPFWTLPLASAHRDLRLMQRLAAREPPTMDEHHRAFLFSEALVFAISAFAPPPPSDECADTTGASDNDTAMSSPEDDASRRANAWAMVTWLCTSYCPSAFILKGLIEAARVGELEVIEWLVAHHGDRLLWSDACGHEAATGGHFDVLKWLHTQNVLSQWWSHGALPESCDRGDLEIVEWLLSIGANQFSPGLSRAVAGGHADVAQLLVDSLEHYEFVFSTAMRTAAVNNQLELLKWLIETYPDATAMATLMDEAAAAGSLEIVQWLHERESSDCTVLAMDGAARSGSLDVVQWLHEHRTEGCTKRAMDDAAENGHLDVVQWLHENRTEGCTPRAMDSAARYGYLDVVQWLHEHRFEGCTFRAMNDAAQCGNWEMIEWLHAHRSEGCSAMGMTMAASSGHLDVLQWLHAKYGKGCTANAPVLAAEAGHLDVLAWLYETFQCELSTDVVDVASTVEVLEWLRAHGIDSCTSRAFDDAASRNNFAKLAHLRTHYPDVECTQFAVDAAIQSDSVEMFLWLRAHFPNVVDIAYQRQFYGEKHHWAQVFDRLEAPEPAPAAASVSGDDEGAEPVGAADDGASSEPTPAQ